MASTGSEAMASTSSEAMASVSSEAMSSISSEAMASTSSEPIASTSAEMDNKNPEPVAPSDNKSSPGSESSSDYSSDEDGSQDPEQKRILKTSMESYFAERTAIENWRSKFYFGLGIIKSHRELESKSECDLVYMALNGWARDIPTPEFYERDPKNPKIMTATADLIGLCEKFIECVLMQHTRLNVEVVFDDPTDEESAENFEKAMLAHVRSKNPRLFTEGPSHQVNDQTTVIRLPKKWGILNLLTPGEQPARCDIFSNNGDKLHHYKIQLFPGTNYRIKTPTIIRYKEHAFQFEGFSMFSHVPLKEPMTCAGYRFEVNYSVVGIEERVPDNFTIHELNLFHKFFFKDILDLTDGEFEVSEDEEDCLQFHFMPRFVRELPEGGKEILPMSAVLNHLIDCFVPLVEEKDLEEMANMTDDEWELYEDDLQGMIVVIPIEKPFSLRLDRLIRDENQFEYEFPDIVQFGLTSLPLTFSDTPWFRKLWKHFKKFEDLIGKMPLPVITEEGNLQNRQRILRKKMRKSRANILQQKRREYREGNRTESTENKRQENVAQSEDELRTNKTESKKRIVINKPCEEMHDVTKLNEDCDFDISADEFYKTGMMIDMVLHALWAYHMARHWEMQEVASVEYEKMERIRLQNM